MNFADTGNNSSRKTMKKKSWSEMSDLGSLKLM